MRLAMRRPPPGWSSLPELKLSADRLYYWDGQRWLTTLSPDGRSRWNGSMWVPVAFAPPIAAPIQPRPSSRVPTDWTRPLSYSVAGWYVLRAIYVVATPFLVAGPMAG